MTRNNLIILALLALVVGAYFAYSMYNKKAVDITKAKVDLVLSANQLLTDYENDETAANEKYLDKVLIVQGTVSQVKENKEANQVYLETSNELSSVICQLDPSVSSFPKEGDEVKIKGICTGYLMDVVLVKSKIELNENK